MLSKNNSVIFFTFCLANLTIYGNICCHLMTTCTQHGYRQEIHTKINKHMKESEKAPLLGNVE